MPQWNHLVSGWHLWHPIVQEDHLTRGQHPETSSSLFFQYLRFLSLFNFKLFRFFSFYPIVWKDHLTRGQHPGTPTSLTRAPFCHPGSYFKLSFKIRRSSPSRPRNSLTWEPRGRVPIKHALTTGPFLPQPVLWAELGGFYYGSYTTRSIQGGTMDL